MTQEKQQFRISVLSLWVGILITIVAALIPLAAKYLLPEHKLEYELVGPIEVGRNTALRVEIRNRGEKVERNVRVWIKADTLSTFFLKHEEGTKPPPPVEISSSTKHSIAREGEYHVIAFGDLRPNEKVTASVLLRGPYYLGGDRYRGDRFSIKSDDRLAENAKPDEPSFLELIYPFGFWMFVIFMVLMGAYAIYFEYLMDPKKKEKYILDQIDKLRQ